MSDDKQTPNDQPENQPEGEKPQDWTSWLAGQTDDVKALYEEHTSGLKSALKSERQRNADMAAELRDAAGKAEGEAKAQLEEMAGRVESESQRADFYEQAAGAGCTDMKLAWLAAREMDAFDRKGRPDIAAVKAAHPSLFARPASADARAGRGAQADNGSASINDMIRRVAGRG